MNLGYFLLLATLKNINCYSSKHQNNPVIPARYKVTSKTNYDPVATQNIPTDYFPEVEYPESIVDSAKPFYLNTSPFSDDVKSSFNTLISKGNSKPKSATDYSWIQNDKTKEKLTKSQKESVKEEAVVDEHEIKSNAKSTNEINTDTKGTNEINTNAKSINETPNKESTIFDFEDDTKHANQYSESDIEKLFTNWTSVEMSAENEDYIAEFIDDMEELMKNLTSIETPEPNEDQDNNNATVRNPKRECSNELTLEFSNMTSHNNDSILNTNENSCPKEEHPSLFEKSDTSDVSSSLISLLNEFITNSSLVDDMESDFCSIGTFANETNTSCTES